MPHVNLRTPGGRWFAASAALLLAGLIALIVVWVQDDLSDAGDDLLPFGLALVGLLAMMGWARDRKSAESAVGAADERDLLERRLSKEREWTRELRGEVTRLHRERGALAHTGDVREMVLQVAMRLTEADKGLLLSREDADGDGELDAVCHLGFENDPAGSAVTQEMAQKVLARDETIREDDSSKMRADGRTPADAEIENLLAIPIFIQDDFSGVLVCANRDGGFEGLDDEVLLSLGDHAGAVLENGRLHGQLRASYMSTVRMLTEAIEVKDPEVRVHSDEVARYVSAVAEALEIEPRRREELIIASLLHDIGKLGISERILLKPGPLTPEERTAIELHPRIGFRLVQQMPALDAIAPAVLHHHERFDGEGYPAGLNGEQIPLEARIICVADSFSAMTAQRPYRSPMSLEDACAELERCAGTQFDPKVVRLFVDEVRRHPPEQQPADGLASALADPEINALRAPGEQMLGAASVAVTDNLTLLYSHRHMHEVLGREAERARVQGSPFAVVVVELTGVAQVNEAHGYAAGDGVIQTAAQAIERAAIRTGGVACRHGGTRLALVLPQVAGEAAGALAEQLDAELRDLEIAAATGCAAWQDGEAGADVLARARVAVGGPASAR